MVLSQQCFSKTFYCNYVVKQVWKKLLAQPHSSPLFFTLIHNASLFLTEIFPKRHKFCSYAIQKVITNILKSENQLDWWKGIRCWRTCQNSNSTDVAEEIKPVYNTNCSQKNNLKTRIQTSVPKFFAIQKRKFSRRQKTYNRNAKVEKVYKRIPPYLTYTGDAIDQGATRLGGL